MLELLKDWGEQVGAVGQVLVAALLSILTVLYNSHAKRKDKLEFFYNNWAKQQDVNIACLTNKDALLAIEHLIYGETTPISEIEARQFTLAFLHINKIQNNYEALKNKIIADNEFRAMSEPSLRLFANSKNMIIYLLDNRGYDDGFADEVKKMLHPLRPYKIPTYTQEDYLAPTLTGSAALVQASILPIEAKDNVTNVFINRILRLSRTRFFFYASWSFILNPILLSIQLYKIFLERSAGSVSIWMMAGFVYLNIITSVAAVKAESVALFISSVLSAIVCTIIFSVMALSLYGIW